MAQTFSKMGAHKNVLQTCDRMIQISSSDRASLIMAWNMRGNALSAAATANPGRLDEAKLREAEVAYREVLKYGSSMNMAHYNLGMTLIRLKRQDEGLEEMRTYLKNAEEEDVAEKARKIIDNPRRATEDFAPDFTLVSSEGEYISSDALRGKVLLLDFWGIWCKPCLVEIPYLTSLAKKYAKGEFVLVSIDCNDEEAKWRQFLSENNMKWTQTRDGDSNLRRLFQISAFPSYVLIDHEGIVRYRGKGSGPQTEGEISTNIKKALKAIDASAIAEKR
jgi:thiol-disulfide isomerase/thioredoxin